LRPASPYLLQTYDNRPNSFLKRAALECMVLATKPAADIDLADWSIAGLKR
jgi:hypothetical protein